MMMGLPDRAVANGGAVELTDESWERIRTLFREAFKTTLHYAFATVGADGTPRVTPIGSLILRNDRTGFYFEEYASGLRRNFSVNNRVCILAVRASKWQFLKALLFGRVSAPFAVRLMGTVGERRAATDEEASQFRRRVARYRMLKGHDLLWGKLKHVRDIAFDSCEPVRIGSLDDGGRP